MFVGNATERVIALSCDHPRWSRRARAAGSLVAIFGLLGCQLHAGSTSMNQGGPSGGPKPGKYEIQSYPIFLVSQGGQSEIVVCEAKMTVQAGEPYLNKERRRQVDLEILDWRAFGRSKFLGGKIEFRMTESRASWVVGGEKSFFPAQARFAMEYAVKTPLGSMENLTGVATGAIKAFPPRQDVFEMKKELRIGTITMTPIACACAAQLVAVQVPEMLTAGVPKPGRYEISSYPIFYVAQGDRSEIVVCKASMTVETGAVFPNKKGRRQMDVKILSWRATGRSKILGGELEYRMTESKESWVVGGERSFFPAEARLAMQYEVKTALGTVGNLTGVASGSIKAFPPRQDIFDFQKDVKIGGVTVTPVACICPLSNFLGVQVPQ